MLLDPSTFEGQVYAEFGSAALDRITANATPEQKAHHQYRTHVKAFEFSVNMTLIDLAVWPTNVKNVVKVLVIAQLFDGSPVGASIPYTFDQGWDAVMNVPDFVGGMTKAQFYEWISEELGICELDGGGVPIEPDWISTPASEPDFSDLDLPLIPESTATPINWTFDGPWSASPATGSPLVLDLIGGGVTLSEFDADTTTTFFDIDSDGFAEQTAWVTDDMGLLARDINENGVIDDASELFGSSTVDGFALLAELDSNGDHVIDQYDLAWGDLSIWVDANEDAVTQDCELHTLSSLDIASIDLAGVTDSTATVSGNPISHEPAYLG